MVAISGSGWRLAPSLVALIEECDHLFPSRSIASDGSIGDAAHAARTSDHNPDDGWVCAVDVTDDKVHGCDADHLAHLIVARRDPRVKYVIWNRTIVKGYVDSAGHPAWTPYPYTGVNAHDKHTHVSVWNTAKARNDTGPWWGEEGEDMALSEDDWKRLGEIVTWVVAAEVGKIRDRLDDVQDNLADVPRRLFGVELMADSAEQHREDEDTGRRMQALLDR